MNQDTLSRNNTAEGVDPSGHGVGALLRASRMRFGESLEEVASVLRIRARHLEALEEGRIADLPGTTYAVGFLRAYAEHLGLDAEEVVRRFKDEFGSEVKGAKARLVLPEPVVEAGTPKGAMVFIGLVVGFLAYGGWYLSSVDNAFYKEWIEPIPDRLANLVPSDNSTPATDPAPEAAAPAATAEPAPTVPAPALTAALEPAATEETVPTEAASTPETALETSQETSPEAGQETAGAVTSSPETVVEEAASAAEPAGAVTIGPDSRVAASIEDVTAEASSETEAAAGAASDSAAQPEETGAAEAATEAVEEAVQATRDAVSPVTTPETAPEAAAGTLGAEAAAAVDAAAGDRDGQPDGVGEPISVVASGSEASDTTGQDAEAEALGAAAEVTSPDAAAAASGTGSGNEEIASAEPASRILLRAKTDSWIKVYEPETGDRFIEKLLPGGETYAVPVRDSIVLDTGDAGALEILVDGELVPPVGDSGDVVRNIALNPESLKRGTRTDLSSTPDAPVSAPLPPAPAPAVPAASSSEAPPPPGEGNAGN